MKNLLIVIFLSLIGCSKSPFITVSEEVNTDEIIILPLFENKDSVEILLPYTFKVNNETSASINRVNIMSRNSNVRRVTQQWFKINDSVCTAYRKEYDDIPSGRSKEFQVYLKVIAAKHDVNSVYSEPANLDSLTFNDLFYSKNNKVPHSHKLYNDLKMKNASDSIAITVHFKDTIQIKIWKLGEKKFKTMTTQDIMNNPNKYTESIFKP